MHAEASNALERLREGNRRFIAALEARSTPSVPLQPVDASADQHPLAIVLGCSDSRVPAEIVFDQGLGELFVIRIAGHVVGAGALGSIEFAASRFGTPLVVVLGHSRCGAVRATLESLVDPSQQAPANVGAIVDRIRPAVAHLVHDQASDVDALLPAAVRANVAASTEELRRRSEVIEGLVADGRLAIVGAEYSLETGRVTFFDADA